VQELAALAALRALPSVTLVERAIDSVASFKHVQLVLAERPPDSEASEWLIAAYRSERAEPWLTAVLLRALRVPASLPVAREILARAHGLLSESYAGQAIARIGGDAARRALLEMLRPPHHRRTRGARASASSN